MKLVSYLKNNEDVLGLVVDDKVYNVQACGSKINLSLPQNMNMFLKDSDENLKQVTLLEEGIKNAPGDFLAESGAKLISPVPHPTSVKDGYAFRQHVQTMRSNRGAEMAPEFDQFPIFYYSNHNATFGPGKILAEKDHFVRLDYELEVSVVIGKEGINIPVEKADDYILGYMIWNDLSARCLQMEEMKLSLGPAKGKDFANAFGPYLVTKDELTDRLIQTAQGQRYDLAMRARLNGNLMSEGNMKTMDWTFAQIIERASYGTTIYPGDIIGSGTVGTGCLAEINGTATRKAKQEGQEYAPTWIQPGDTVELEIEMLGVLKNTLELRNPEYSILSKKKHV